RRTTSRGARRRLGTDARPARGQSAPRTTHELSSEGLELMAALRVAMIGHGFMGAAHSQGWRVAPRFFDLPRDVELTTVVGRRAEGAAAAAAKWGWAESSDDWRAVIARDDIDIVDVVTPGDSHA